MMVSSTVRKERLAWSVGHMPSADALPQEIIPSSVPGAVQLDYAKAHGYAPYWYGLNFHLFDWMENEFFVYSATLDFDCRADETASLVFEGIDYAYTIAIDGQVIYSGEGMFTPISIDVTEYRGRPAVLTVTILPIPKCTDEHNRSQARASCKPASSYGWDWHPRLVPSGIWGDAYLRIAPSDAPVCLEASYRLSEDLSSVVINARVSTYAPAKLNASLIAPNGDVVAETPVAVGDTHIADFTLSLNRPLLWYPRGYGDQPIYTLQIHGSDTLSRKIGFRRSRLVENQGVRAVYEAGYPKGPIPYPMTVEINGHRIFAKGSNWVNAEIFPSMMTDKRYDELLDLAVYANMNILRMWGGQFINHEHFYDRCDELGIMIWQEFMLSCNCHPDDDAYLTVLKQEATTIIRRLRTHPCIAFWCGGNELFNSWSGMTAQSHALRALNALCYQHDRFTPFNMTSPLYGVSHGSYANVHFTDEHPNGEEFIRVIKRSRSTAFTEFGCNGGAGRDYILKYIMDENDYEDCTPKNELWRAHHAFQAWEASSWLGIPEIEYFFGESFGTDDIIEKSVYLQNLCYKTMFEEMRRQAPRCSMAINWDFNEPWPCAAGNSLISWPAQPKPCLDAVKEALRPQLLSLEAEQNGYLSGEIIRGYVWMLNDSDEMSVSCTADVYLITDNDRELLGTVDVPEVSHRSNARCGSFDFLVAEKIPTRFQISIECKEYPEWNSVYDFVHRPAKK